jgi:hypothetical protein
MATTLSQRIAQRAQTKKPTQQGKNRAAFLAVRDDVQNALNDGWSVKTIWETLREEGRIQFGYDAFMGYVKRLIRSGQPTAPTRDASSTVLPSEKRDQGKPAPEAAAKKADNAIGGFTFDPSPNKEDLL